MNLSRTLALVFLISVFSLTSHAAPQAVCTFTTFAAPSGYTLSAVNGISDDGTLVGQLEKTATLALVGFKRTADGTITAYTAPNSRTTWLYGRNASDASVGFYLDTASAPHVHGFLLQGTKFSTINYPSATSTWTTGINQLGTVVGAFSKPAGTKGFRLANGKYTVIAYTGAQTTFPQAINDNGDIVGSYSSSPMSHGFLWQNGKFTTIDWAGSIYGSLLTGVNNSSVIVGNKIGADHDFGFLYKNGVIKRIVYAGAVSAMTGGINNNGVVAGTIDFKGGKTLGYTAVCE